MAKYVLLAFDDDADADRFVEGFFIEDNEPVGGGGIHPILNNAQVRGVWKKPTKFCQCGAKTKAYGRSRKYGWWCCVLCGKPKQAWAEGNHWFATLGYNLLPLSDEAPEYRGQPNEKEWLEHSQRSAIAKTVVDTKPRGYTEPTGATSNVEEKNG